MGLANPGSNRAVMNEEVEMKNGGVLAASFEFLGGFAALFLEVVMCRSSSWLELFHWWDGDWEPEFQDCDGEEGEFEVKPLMGSLYGFYVGFKYIDQNLELGHSKCKVGRKKKE